MEELADILPEIDAASVIPDLDFLQKATRIKLINIIGHGIDCLNQPEIKRIIRERKHCHLQSPDRRRPPFPNTSWRT